MSINQKGIVYALKHNLKYIYVGRSFGNKRVEKLERRKEHFRYLRNNNHPIKALQEIYNKYGENSIEFEVLESYEEITEAKLDEREMFYISTHGTYKDGFNSTYGGKTVTGMNHSEETKQRISKKIKGELNGFYGKTHTKDARQKMSESQKGKAINENQRRGLSSQWEKGKPKTKEHRMKISQGLKGRKYSEETLLKMSESQKGKKWSEESKQKRLETIRKLPDEIIYEIHMRANNEKTTNRKLAIEYGVGQTLVSNIKNLTKKYIREAVEKQKKLA